MYTVKAHPGYIVVYKDDTHHELVLAADLYGHIHDDVPDTITDGPFAKLPEYTRERITEAAREAEYLAKNPNATRI